MLSRRWRITPLLSLSLISAIPAFASDEARSNGKDLPCSAFCQTWMNFGRDTPPAPVPPHRTPEITPALAPKVVSPEAKGIAKPIARMPDQPRRAAERATRLQPRHAIVPASKPVVGTVQTPPAAISVPEQLVAKAAVPTTVEPILPEAIAAPEPIAPTAFAVVSGPGHQIAADPLLTPAETPADAPAIGPARASAPPPLEIKAPATPWSVKLGFYAVLIVILGWGFRPRGQVKAARDAPAVSRQRRSVRGPRRFSSTPA